MFVTELVRIQCPYCGEPIEIVIDCSINSQQYIEDCEVCCRPIVMIVGVDDQGQVTIDARDENSC